MKTPLWLKRLAGWAIGAAILTGSASAQLNSNAGQININTKPPRTPWVIATTFQLNMGGTDPTGWIELTGPPFQRIAIEQISFSARVTSGTTLRCAFDMAPQQGSTILPFVALKSVPVNRLGTEVIGSEKVLMFLESGDKAHFRCSSLDGAVQSGVAVTLVGRYE